MHYLSVFVRDILVYPQVSMPININRIFQLPITLKLIVKYIGAVKGLRKRATRKKESTRFE